MHHGTYPNSTHAQAPPPGQDSSSSGSREVNNAVNDVPLSRLDFQGEQYASDFFQQGHQIFTNPHALVSQTQSAFPQPLAIPVLPGNPSQVYGGTQSRETAPNNVTGTNFWDGIGQPPIPYEQPKQVNYHSERIGDTGVGVAGDPPTALPPPPPGVGSTPNQQGIYDHVWKLSHIGVENESSGDLRVIIYIKKVPSQAA